MTLTVEAPLADLDESSTMSMVAELKDSVKIVKENFFGIN